MADDTVQGSGNARVAGDELTTLNGVATVADGSGRLPLAQRFKMLFGSDGSGTDVSTTNPLPTTVRDTAGVAATTLADGMGGVGLGVSQMATNFIISTANSTTAQLASGATYNGTIESCFNQQTISALFVADQTCTITIRQWIDAGGTKKASEWTFTVNPSSTGGFSRSFVANGNFVSFHVTNLGLATTTTLDLNVAFGTLPSATNLGNEPVSVNEVNGIAIGARPDGYINYRQDPTTMLVDTFETIDTLNTWTIGGTTVPTGSAGILTVSPGTAANGQSFARSQPTFVASSPSWLQGTIIATVDAAAKTGNKRVFGFGIPNATPTVAVPITNGIVFEFQDTDGSLIGAVYSNSVRTATVALTRPTDGANHRYGMIYKTSRVYFDIDGIQVGSIAYPNPQVSALPMVILSVNGGTALGSAAVLTASVMSTADTGRNNVAISDFKFPWREVRVTPTGELVTTDTVRLKQATALAHSGRFTVLAAADAATAGRMWLINPVGSTVLLELRRVEFTSTPTAATAFVSSPRITVERVTFTGTATGATITPSVRDSNDTALVGSVRTASTGLTLTAGAVAYGFTVAPILTAVGAAMPSLLDWEPNENGRLVLRAGQGIVVRQADAGTASDTRSYNVNFAWSEFTVLA